MTVREYEANLPTTEEETEMSDEQRDTITDIQDNPLDPEFWKTASADDLARLIKAGQKLAGEQQDRITKELDIWPKRFTDGAVAKLIEASGLPEPAPAPAPPTQESLLGDIKDLLVENNALLADIKDQLAQQQINTVTDNHTPPKLNEDRVRWAEAKIQKSKLPDKGHRR